MTYSIREYKQYNEAEIVPIYKSVGWVNYTHDLTMLREAFEHSLKILAAYDNEKIVGLIRVVGDGASIVYIQDILVLPEFQRKGIGTSLLKGILAEYKNVYQKVLMTDHADKNIQFYKSLGF